MIRIGVIGCGRIAQSRHLPEYSENENVIIAAVYSPNRERASGVGAQYGASVYDSCEDLIADPQIDAVSVCTPNATHFNITVKALRAGKHVLCEKPMATTPEECELMVSTARETGKHLMIAHNQRFAAAHVEAKKMIAQGAIGKILTFRTIFGHKGPESWTINAEDNWFFDKARAAFGVIADLGAHKIDLLHYLTSSRIISATALTGTFDKKRGDGRKIDVDDNAICIFEMDNGSAGTMTVSWTRPGPEENSTVFYGTQGVLRIYDDPESSLIIERSDGSRVLAGTDKIATNEEQTKSGVIDSWINSLVTNTPPEIPIEESHYTMNALFAAMESARTRTPVAVS